MKILKTIILIFLCSTSFGQEPIMYLHSWKNPKKVDKINNNVYLEISLHSVDSIGKSYPTIYSGVLVSTFPDRIVMNVNEELLEKKTINGTIINTSNTYTTVDSLKNKSGIIVNSESADKRRALQELNNISNISMYKDSLNERIKTININSISSIYYSKSKKIANVGIGLMVLSGITGLLVAPPVSINFRTGHFNQNTYYSVLAASGTAFAVGLPLYCIFTKTKQYRIKTYSPESNDNNYYSIQTK